MSDKDEREEERDDVAGVSLDEIGFEHADMAEDRPHTHDDELLDAFGDGSHTPIVTDPEDGLPRPADGWVAPAPKLSTKSFLCLEDESQFVELFQEDTSVKNVFLDAITRKPEGARKIMAGRRSAYGPDGEPVPRRTFKPDQVVEMFGIQVVRSGVNGSVVVPVMPIRPRCSNLVRQIIDSSDVDAGGVEVRPMFTYCKAFKSVSGAYLSLMDRAIYACEHRTPRDLISDKEIVRRIKDKIRQGEERVAVMPLLTMPKPENPFEGEETYKVLGATVSCDPKYAPGKKVTITLMNPSAWDGHELNVLYFGRHIQREQFSRLRTDVGFHSILSGEDDYAPEDTSPEDLKAFCESWPLAAEFEYLSTNLENTPRFLANRILQGENLAILAKHRKDAMFALALIRRELKLDIDTTGLRPEHLSYLERTKAHS